MQSARFRYLIKFIVINTYYSIGERRKGKRTGEGEREIGKGAEVQGTREIEVTKVKIEVTATKTITRAVDEGERQRERERQGEEHTGQEIKEQVQV